MPKSNIYEGNTTNEAIEKGLKDLKVSRDKVDIKIIEEGKRSLAFSLTFGSQDKTLTDDEINPVIEKIIAMTEKEFKAELRK